MRRSVSLIVLVLIVLAVTRPSLVVNCRVLKATHHEPVKDLLQVPTTSAMKEKANTDDNISTRVLIDGQVHAMSSGPSRRGSGH
uniref:Uncharacterized protein n=1 Tax=Cajanus cajan TaxID=3821 RepID=A0A151SC79_CAJCA|nr:hypothetical protein KK1_025740 [Cajanus cajan]